MSIFSLSGYILTFFWCSIVKESLRQQVAAQITSHSEVAKTLTEDEKKEIDARSVHVAGVRLRIFLSLRAYLGALLL